MQDSPPVRQDAADDDRLTADQVPVPGGATDLRGQGGLSLAHTTGQMARRPGHQLAARPPGPRNKLPAARLGKPDAAPRRPREKGSSQ